MGYCVMGHIGLTSSLGYGISQSLGDLCALCLPLKSDKRSVSHTIVQG
jgi:hypothetical protein